MDAYKLAKEKYLSFELHNDVPPSVKDLAVEFGIDESFLKNKIKDEFWLDLRRIKQDEFKAEIVKFDQKNITKRAKNLADVRLKLFTDEIELVESQFHRIVGIMNTRLDNTPTKELIAYLKIIQEISKGIQTTIDSKVEEKKKEAENSLERLLSGINMKSKLIKVIENKPDDPYEDERDKLFEEGEE